MTLETTNITSQAQGFSCFATAVYKVLLPQYVDVALEVGNEYIKNSKQNKKCAEELLYPAYMSTNMYADPRIIEFSRYAAQTCWEALKLQGYNVDATALVYGEMWMQEHHKGSSMDYHVHGQNAQIVAFYFLEVPEDSSKLLLHDPRVGKVQADLAEKDDKVISYASKAIAVTPEVGMLYITNAWLPHSFTRHGNKKPLKFLHITLYPQNVEQQQQHEVEIV